MEVSNVTLFDIQNTKLMKLILWPDVYFRNFKLVSVACNK